MNSTRSIDGYFSIQTPALSNGEQLHFLLFTDLRLAVDVVGFAAHAEARKGAERRTQAYTRTEGSNCTVPSNLLPSGPGAVIKDDDIPATRPDRRRIDGSSGRRSEPESGVAATAGFDGQPAASL